MRRCWLAALALTFEVMLPSLAIAASREIIEPLIHEAIKGECCQAPDTAKKISSLNRLHYFWAIVPDPEPGEANDHYSRRIEEYIRTIVSECRNYEGARTKTDHSCDDLLNSF
jgi:hypothetical protein